VCLNYNDYLSRALHHFGHGFLPRNRTESHFLAAFSLRHSQAWDLALGWGKCECRIRTVACALPVAGGGFDLFASLIKLLNVHWGGRRASLESSSPATVTGACPRAALEYITKQWHPRACACGKRRRRKLNQFERTIQYSRSARNRIQL
jgi:hypothetical protein